MHLSHFLKALSCKILLCQIESSMALGGEPLGCSLTGSGGWMMTSFCWTNTLRSLHNTSRDVEQSITQVSNTSGSYQKEWAQRCKFYSAIFHRFTGVRWNLIHIPINKQYGHFKPDNSKEAKWLNQTTINHIAHIIHNDPTHFCCPHSWAEQNEK